MIPDFCVGDPSRYPDKAEDVYRAHEIRRQRSLAQCLTDEAIAEYAANPWGATGPHSLNLQKLLRYFATWGVGGAWHRIVAIEAGHLYGIARVDRGAAPRLLDEPRCKTFDDVAIALFKLRCAALKKCLNTLDSNA